MNFIHLFFLSLLDDETNRTYTELKAINMQCFVLPCENLQCDPTNVETQMINPIPSTQLRPSSAVRSIVYNLIQHHIPLSSSSKAMKRRRQVW